MTGLSGWSGHIMLYSALLICTDSCLVFSYFVILKANFSLGLLNISIYHHWLRQAQAPGAPPFFFFIVLSEREQFSLAVSIMTDTPWPTSPTTYKLQMWLLQMVSWERHTITNWNGASHVAGLPDKDGKMQRKLAWQSESRMRTCCLLRSLTV